MKKRGRKRIERKWPFFLGEEDRTRGKLEIEGLENSESKGKRVVFHSKSDQEEGRKSISPTPTSLTLLSFGWDNFD